MEPLRLSLLARLCWALDARRWLLSLGNVIAAMLFVVGCVGFYRPMWYVGSVTLFLVGSVLFLLAALVRPWSSTVRRPDPRPHRAGQCRDRCLWPASSRGLAAWTMALCSPPPRRSVGSIET